MDDAVLIGMLKAVIQALYFVAKILNELSLHKCGVT
jgi:hypothetical protein